MGTQNAIAADAPATVDLCLAVRFERVEHDLMNRLVEGTASTADRLLVPALVSRDQILGPVSAWCPWWWRSARYVPGHRTHVTPQQHARRAPEAACFAAAQHKACSTEAHRALQEANAFIAVDEKYLPIPQMDSTDATSAAPECDTLPSSQRCVGTRTSSGHLALNRGRACEE